MTRTLLALCLASVCLAAPPVRDWKTNPAIVEATAPGDLWAMGDIHGDYERMLALVEKAGLAAHPAKPEDARWTGGNAVLVVTGDMIDKGPKPVSVLRFLAALRRSAATQGGRVIVTMGNHEAEFLAGPDAKKAEDFLADLKREHIASADITACHGDLGEFLCALPFGAKVGDWFFSHGGNTQGRSIAQMEAQFEKEVSADGFRAKALSDPDSLLEARLGEGAKGTWFHVKGAKDRDTLASYARAAGVKHIVQGHQHNDVAFDDGEDRHTGEMFQYQGLLFLIDVGMSRGVGDSSGALLRIHNNQASGMCPDGGFTPLWDPKTNTPSGRLAPCK